ncbi:MAG: efflux RND transporter permease subunit, partial [Deltaproteobacteria bacterium]|nr:efflux RND transporter permease subunit [Kofleriaceae bacterium]
AERGGAPVRVRDVAVITQRAEATCLVDGQDPGAKDSPALVRVGLRHPKDAAAVEQELRKAGLAPLRGAATVHRPGRPARVELVTAPVGPVIEAVLFGDDALALAEQGGAAVVAARETPGIAAAWCEGCELSTTQAIEIDRPRAAALGVTVADVAQVLGAAMAGQPVAMYRDGADEVAVVLGIEEGGTRWPELTVRGAAGAHVPLRDLVSMSDARHPADLLHVDGRRAVALRLRGAPKTTVAELKKLATSLLPGARVQTLDPVSVDAAPW